MSLRVHNVIHRRVRSRRSRRVLARAMGHERATDEEGIWCAPLDPEGGGVPVGLQVRDDVEVPEAVNRIHMDLMADDVGAEVERLLAPGAVPAEDWPYPPEATFVAPYDPSGDELCETESVDCETDLAVSTSPWNPPGGAHG